MKKLLGLSFLLCVLAACQSVTPTPAPTPTPDTTLIRQQWQKSPHANTFDQGKGPNTYCARCHSPRNWDPAAKIDPQPNCVSCKFAFDPAMRIAKSNPPVAKVDWKDIGCEVCHKTENGITLSQIAWLDNATGKYEAVADATALCEKCHTDTETIRHKRDVSKSAHANYGCTKCHDAHSTVASCSTQACHPNALNPAKPILGHDKAHATVSCIACHDTAQFKVGIDKPSGMWITFRTNELMGRSTTAVYKSHAIVRAVDCNKCHAPNNPWGLKPVESGAK
ncbi:MAG: hypothetical protein HZC40_06275 [Chloroflexi bacterium]|nr:hypothetical protein [Chloroflexota bacterium]